MLLNIHKLLQGNKKAVTHPFVKKFSTFKALENYAKNSSDVSLIGKIEVSEF